MNKELFPDNCYSKESGGDPAHITDLTYEQYLDSYNRFYSASNARIFLDGMIDLDDVFSLLDAELSKHERTEVNADIPFQKPVCPPEITAYYPVGEDGETEGKTLLATSWVFADYRDIEKTVAANLVFNILCSNNESPLKKAVADSGLATDVVLGVDDVSLQAQAFLEFKDTDPENKEALYKIADTVIKKAIEEGIDKDELEAAFNRWEFNKRQEENAFKGYSNGCLALCSWLYEGDPAEAFCHDTVFPAIRKRINDGSGYFEKLLKEIFYECGHKASVVLIPSKTMMKELDDAEEERARKVSEAWTPAQRRKVLDDMAELQRFQDTDDSDIADKCMPKLKISDIETNRKPILPVEDTFCGRPILRHLHPTNGLTYTHLYFEVSDFNEDEFFMLQLLQVLFSKQNTSRHSAAEIQHILKRDTGAFSKNIHVKTLYGSPAVYRFRNFLIIRLGALEAKQKEAYDILSEILTLSDYSDIQKIKLTIKRQIAHLENKIKNESGYMAMLRAHSMLCQVGCATETREGIEALMRYRRLQTEMETEEGCRKTVNTLQAMAKRVFCRARLQAGITGNVDEKELESLFMSLPEGDKPGPTYNWPVREKVNEGIEIPSQVGYAETVGRFDGSFPYDASTRIAERIINEELWNEIRIKGGAYGAGLYIRYEGRVWFESYRDPKPEKSLDVYKKCSNALRNVNQEDLEAYILTAYGNSFTLETPHGNSYKYEDLWTCGFPLDNEERVRKAILGTTLERLNEIADMLDKVLGNSVSVVIGGPKQINACKGKLDKITKVF